MQNTWKSSIKQNMPYFIGCQLVKLKGIYKQCCFCIGGGIRIPFLVVSVGQACNLKCRDCGNFAPYAPTQFRRYQLDDILRDLRILLKNVSLVEHLQIQGGEPFLYTDLPEVIRFIGEEKREKKVGNITIATNGSIIPPDSLMEVIREYDAEIRISDYGIAQDQSEKLSRRCDSFGIKNYCYKFVSGQSMWYEQGGLHVQRENDTQKVWRRFVECSFRGCLTLERGTLAHCSRATNSFAIQKFDRNPSDYLEVSDENGFKKKFRNYLAEPHFMEACRYCNGTDEKRKVPSAIQLEDGYNRKL